MKKNLIILSIVFIIASTSLSSQNYNVFWTTNSSSIFQRNAGLFGVGFVNATSPYNTPSGILSQLTVNSNNPQTPLFSLTRNNSTEQFYIDFDGKYTKFGISPTRPTFLIENALGNMAIGTMITTPARLSVGIDFNVPNHKICIATSVNSSDLREAATANYVLLDGPGASISNAFYVSNSYTKQWGVFKILGDGTTYIGGSNYFGTYGNAKLHVNGLIAAKEIIINSTDWSTYPDFVFKSSYNLISLPELEKFINQNGHLPEVPSLSEVSKDGYLVGEMNSTLLKKVEELTLYVIQLHKEIENMKNINNK